jgi:hypothetical protein
MKVFSIPVMIHATVYVRAENAGDALSQARDLVGGAVYAGENEDFCGKDYSDSYLPDVSISPAMTVGELDPHFIEEVHDLS